MLKNRKNPTNKQEQHQHQINKSNTLGKEKKESNTKSSFLYKNVFLIILAVRSLSVYFNLIWDCDETYNYWEPLHFLAYGNGLQTWEYSPKYSLRSYLYLFAHLAPVYPFTLFLSSKISIFYLVRFVLALVSSYVEASMYKSLLALSQKDTLFKYVPNFYLLFSLSNVGMFTSTTSFLPSTFSMYLVTYAYSQMYSQKLNRSIFAIGLAILLGWPFVLILGVPIALDFIFLNSNSSFPTSLFNFIKTTIFYALIITIPTVLFDSYFFGKIVFAPLNIFIYNVFETSKGPDLYGREPFSFYIKNLLLNFNILFPLSILSVFSLIKSKSKHSYLTFLGMFLWLLVFTTRPHKEERFMYPIYPLFLINSSLFLSFLCTKLEKYTKLIHLIPKLLILLHLILSISRILALLFNFSASMQIYFALNEPKVKFSSSHLEFKPNINVCVSKEWYRFPSYFFIPENTELQKWNLRFLESDFKGQLPGYFNLDWNKSIIQSTRHVDELFNDFNQEVKERYVQMDKCDFFIDTDNLDDGTLFKETKLKWKTLVKLPFLDMGNEQNNNIFKSFYIPSVYEKRIKFTYFKLRVRLP